MNDVYVTIETVLKYIVTVGGGMFTVLPLAVFIRVIAALRLKKLGMFTTRAHEITAVLFIMYCAGLVAVTITPSRLTFNPSLWNVNLLPFYFLYDLFAGCYVGHPAAAMINVIGNVAVFVPFGFLLSLPWRDAGWRKAVIVSAGVSLCIELCQLPQPSRATDIDDIILNTLGGLLGYLLFTLIKSETVRKFRVIT